jgi:hypothetical protein
VRGFGRSLPGLRWILRSLCMFLRGWRVKLGNMNESEEQVSIKCIAIGVLYLVKYACFLLQ